MQKNGFIYRCCLAFVCNKGKATEEPLNISKERNKVTPSCITNECLCLRKALSIKTTKKKKKARRRSAL